MQSSHARFDEKTDVVIVGTGFAGLAAAIEAYDAGASVTILEKRSTPGGNSIIAGGGVNAVDPERQKPQGVEDSVDLHFKQTFESGDCLGDPERMRFMVENALEMCITWLENIGVIWSENVVQGFGALWQRTHLPIKYKKYSGGAAITHAELDQVRRRRIPILLRHKVTKILRENPLKGKVYGIEAIVEGKRICFKAKKAVVLASGGFAANFDMVIDHDRRLANSGTTNHRGANGECIKIAQDIGACAVGMDYIQCIPRTVGPGFQVYYFVISSREMQQSPNDSYRIFINKEGNRFVREDGRRDKITYAALAQQPFVGIPSVEADTIEELEKKLGIPTSNLVNTVEKYNSYCVETRDQDFGKLPPLLIPCIKQPFKAEPKAPARHHTMGGLKVGGKAGQVVDRHCRIIPNLYAAGEATGGFHGANRVGHNATAECIIFGRMAGRSAVAGRARMRKRV